VVFDLVVGPTGVERLDNETIPQVTNQTMESKPREPLPFPVLVPFFKMDIIFMSETGNDSTLLVIK
jgi:hypothetical protein